MPDQPSLFADPEAVVEAAPVVSLEPEDPQMERLRRWDFRTYDASDERQRAVVEQMLRQPLPKVKK